MIMVMKMFANRKYSFGLRPSVGTSPKKLPLSVGQQVSRSVYQYVIMSVGQQVNYQFSLKMTQKIFLQFYKKLEVL